MMILVGYATREGQSRKIARWVADRISARGESVELLSLADTEGLELERFQGAVLVASVHAGAYPAALGAFLDGHADALRACPALFLSVSLAAAGHDADDWKGLAEIVTDLRDATGWTPQRVEHIAGAYKPSHSDLVTRFIMRRIIAEKDPKADLATDHDYTDWGALGGDCGHLARRLMRLRLGGGDSIAKPCLSSLPYIILHRLMTLPR